MQPVRSDLHIDKLLSNISIRYMNAPDSYVADKAFPVVPVNDQSGKFAKYTKGFWFRNSAKKRAPLTESAGGGYGMDTPGTFYCDNVAFHKDIPDDDRMSADPVFDIEADAAEYSAEKIKIYREVDWATKYFTTGKWSTELQGQTTGVGDDEFLCWDEDDSHPVTDIRSAKTLVKLLTGRTPNTLVVSEKVHNALAEHADVTDKYKYTQKAIITPQLLAGVFEVDKYLIASAVYETADEGLDSSLAFICGQYDALLVYAAPRPGKRTPSGGYTFRWNRPMFNGKQGTRLSATARKFRLPKVEGDRVEVSSYEDQKLVAADCGVFFDDAIADGRGLS